MPTVPTYNSPQVRDRGVAQVRVNDSLPVEAFGGGRQIERLTNAVQDLGRGVDDAFEKARDDADRVEVMRGANELEAAENNELLNPETGALNSKGKSAFERSQKARENMRARIDQIAETLSNDRQKEKFKAFAQGRFNDFDRKLLLHENEEGKRYDNQQTELFVANERNAAVREFNNPKRVEQSLVNQEVELKKFAERNGLPPEWVEKSVLESKSKTHAGIIERLLNENKDIEAKSWYEKNQDQLTEDQKTDLIKTLEVGSLRAEGMRRSDLLFNKYRNNMSQAFEEARQIDDPKLRDETMERLRGNFAIYERAEREKVENLHKTATDIIETQGSVDKIPASIWKQFSLSERSQLKNYAQARAEGRDVQTDWDVYYDLRTMAAQPELREKFMQTNLIGYRNKLGNTEFKQLVELQAGLRNGDGRAAKTLDGIRSDRQIVMDALESAGFRVDAKASKSDKRAVNEFFRQVDEHVQLLQETTGKKAKNEDVQKIVDNLMVEGITKKGLLFDTRKRVFELEPGESLEIEVDDIPRIERERIEDALKRNGKAVNDTAIVELYSRKLESMRGK